MRKSELIFLPTPAPGHLVSTVEFSKRLISRNAGISVTILVINSPFSRGVSINKTDSTQDEENASRIETGIRYVDLPQVDLPPPELFKESLENTISVYIASHRTHVRDAITNLQNSSTVHVAGLVLDMFCTSMIDIANELGVASYLFFCSSAAFLGFLLHLKVHSEEAGITQFEQSDDDAIIPCFQNPVPSRVLPAFAFNRVGYKAFMDLAERYGETKGIIVNTYAELEPHALKSLADVYKTAPVYTVGPVLDLDSQVHKQCDAEERDRIMGWLDKQMESSVVFLCFGSGGSFSEEQIREISKGLIRSGQRFLWSLRKPPTGEVIKPSEYTEMELKSILDEEFMSLLEKEEAGLVCGWAPQVEILSHKGIGAFVSHCGWNSTLESLWFGKPIVTWPLYAEQQMNAFELARELGIAVELRLDYMLHSNNLVLASEVERAVKSVMEKDNPVRYKVKEMSDICRRALMEGGSSFRCVDQFITNFLGEIDLHAH
uniref:Glycosyltransferase n=1 Tax=Fagopyrum tataricum TaxID=62330 RepID=A0A1P8SFY7_FAGTA|nr:UGT5 [Fagopyrum tataricum]